MMNKQEMQNKIKELEKQLTELKEELNKPESKSWKPKCGERYYVILESGGVSVCVWKNDKYDNRFYAIGNSFKTIEEAKFEVERLKVSTELKRFAEEHNEPLDWDDHMQPKFFIRYDFIQSKIITNFDTAIMGNCTYFSSIELAKQAVKQIGEDKIKKYYLGVEL